jgi:hypothetical protein
MSNTPLLASIFLMSFATLLDAASVVKLADGAEVAGKLTLSPSGIHVAGASGADINLDDVLEAHFSDGSGPSNCFFSSAENGALPPGWKAQDIGNPAAPGALSYASGAFTLTSGQWDQPQNNQDLSDHCFFAGMPWTGDGQWTVRLKNCDNGNGFVHGGFMLRESLNPLSAITGVSGWDTNNVFMFARTATRSTWANLVAIDAFPVWFRLTRQGPSVNFELSPDGEKWTLINLSTLPLAKDILAGVFVDSHPGKVDRKIVIDQALFTPAPGPTPTRVVPTGLLLCSGSFVAGYYNPIDFDRPDPTGYFTRNEKNTRIEIVASKTAAAVYHPVTRKQLSDVAAQSGVILKNGDFMDGNFEAINAGGVRLNSILLGTESYDRDQVCACSLHPVKPLPAAYEVRLHDGSSIHASSLGMNNGLVAIAEVSGITFNVAPEEIAQFRAGSSRTQNLFETAWKPTPAQAAPEAKTNAAADNASAVQCWTGDDQEQIMAVPAGTRIDFPLAEKFRAVALRIGFSSDSPPGSQATIHVLADGKEVAATPPFKAGDQPRFMEATLQDPRSVALIADSTTPGARILFVDPVAIRDNPTAAP